jgi:hypothetical protein
MDLASEGTAVVTTPSATPSRCNLGVGLTGDITGKSWLGRSSYRPPGGVLFDRVMAVTLARNLVAHEPERSVIPTFAFRIWNSQQRQPRSQRRPNMIGFGPGSALRVCIYYLALQEELNTSGRLGE